ncbi:protein piccolo-like isoform X2 [Pseudophryne corroboree]|uniref:protein piccolo-like isoform X2 n=1 Tax=Pseudophryne corroboree TaxID=495146 RepID=UPI003081E791
MGDSQCLAVTMGTEAQLIAPRTSSSRDRTLTPDQSGRVRRGAVRQRSSTARPQPTLPRDADGGNAGSSSANPPTLRRPSQGSVTVATRPPKRRRLEAPAPAPASPPQRRISAVSAVPPLALLASPQSEDPQSPQLSDPAIITEDAQQERDQETFTLHLQPIDLTQTTTPQDIPQPPQTSHCPQLSTTQVDTQMGPEFWSRWSSQQAQYCASLNTHSQYLSSLPHHLPRLSRNSGRLIVQVGRIANSMEQMRADNTQMQSNLQRILAATITYTDHTTQPNDQRQPLTHDS